MDVLLDRDSVAAGDDVESHVVTVEIDPRRKVGNFLTEIRRREYLPFVHGGAATWVVRAGGRQGPAVAVVASQWDRAALLVDPSAELADFGDRYFFEYLAQEDPQRVVDRLME